MSRTFREVVHGLETKAKQGHTHLAGDAKSLSQLEKTDLPTVCGCPYLLRLFKKIKKDREKKTKKMSPVQEKRAERAVKLPKQNQLPRPAFFLKTS